MWVIRGGEDDRSVEAFIDQAMIAVGFPEVPDAEILTRTEIRRFLPREGTPAAIDAQVAVLSAFVREIQDGESVLVLDPRRNEVVVGTVSGRYEFAGELPAGELRHRRPVEWLARHAVGDLPAAVQGVARQKGTLQQHRDAEWSAYLAQVRDGTVGRDPADRGPIVAAAPRSTRAPRAARPATPRATKPVVAQRTCPSCFLATHPDRFRGDICVDCAE